jgi:hypothetical protein
MINHLMGNFRWFLRVVPGLLRPGERLIEIGAGAGELSARLAAIGVRPDGLDLCAPPPDWPAGRRWHRCDVRNFDGFADYDVVLANLVLHHFAAEDLARLGQKLRGRVRVIVASEPDRRRRWRFLCGALWPFLGPVTRHDARVSIEAGFRGAELAQALGLEGGRWSLAFHGGAIGANRLAAVMSK